MIKCLNNFKYDFPASIIVFFIAVPLCLGIALASGTPLFSGIIAGVVGGIVVGMISNSQVGVSGPAAGLVAIVITSVSVLNNSWEAFLVCIIIAGVLQVLTGLVGGGIIAYYFPSSVIKGMLTGIGAIIIIKQLPHALGYDKAIMAEGLLLERNHDLALANVIEAFISTINPAILIVSFCSLFILLLWDNYLLEKSKFFRVLQGPLVAVLAGILLNFCFQQHYLPFHLNPSQMVNIPISSSLSGLLHLFTFPDFSQLMNIKVYQIAITIALVASVETLLSVEATDKLDPYKRVTPPNRELIAQGIGNICSGLIGGLPITQVVVRSSANITFGARSKMATIYHGMLILVSVLAIPHVLNMIPLASLAIILIMVGYKLAKPSHFIEIYKQGPEQFIPFIITAFGVVYFNLLTGVAIGMSVGIFTILRNNYKNSHHIVKDSFNLHYHINLAEEVSFLNKGSIVKELEGLPETATVLIDASKSKVIDHDVLEVIKDFIKNSRSKNITVQLQGFENR